MVNKYVTLRNLLATFLHCGNQFIVSLIITCVEIDDHRDILNQNPVVMIARIFNNLSFNVKMLEDKNDFIRNIKEIVNAHQFYDMNEFFNV